MKRVVTAIESGRCAIAVSGSLLNDPEVMLALRDRAALPSMALSGPAMAPVQPVNEGALARTVNGPGGLIVIVNPQTADLPGVQALAEIVQKGSHKPQILVAAQQYNPFLFGQAFRGLAVGHIKSRGKEFLTRDLPVPPEVAPTEESGEAAPKAKQKVSTGPEAPRFAFVGRDDELAQLGEFLQSGGPIVVSGGAGIGKSLLVEHAVAASGLTRLPDLVLGWGTGADALFARIGELAKLAGSDALTTVLQREHTPVEAVKAAIEALQAASGTEGQVMVVSDLHQAMGRDDDFFRKSRLELLIEALLTNTYPLRLVFLSRQQPVFHRERAAESLRRLPIGGLKGRFLHEIFEAYKAPEFSRDKFGPLSDKIHGHPFVARMYAIAVRDRENGLDLLDDPKFLKMEGPEDLERLRKLLERKVEKLGREDREVLALVAHFRLPVTGQMMSDLGIGRKQRLQLLAEGLLDMVGTAEDKRYQVHSLVRSTLSLRETSDFDTLVRVSELYARMARDASGMEKLALVQEANRNAILARNPRGRLNMPYPDDDPILEAVAGMIRGKKTNFELAAELLSNVLKANPGNSDAWLLQLEGMQRANAPKEMIEASVEAAVEKAPVPEVFHQVVSYEVHRKARGKATTLLERGIELLPDQSRLRTRLAALLMRQGRRKEAIDHLRAAMELDPMLPDAYGLLGTARRDEGVEALDEAEQLLREAVRLAPNDPTQIARLVDLLLARSRVDPARRTAFQDEAKELLDRVLRGDRRTADAHLLMGQIAREQGDLERASWLLKKARKLTERGQERNQRIALEEALVDFQRGELDEAERAVRDLAVKDPSNHAIFGALAKLLEARELYIPAHAEVLRARERTPKSSLERQLYDAELARLQAIIEAQVAGMMAGEAPPTPEPAVAPITGHQRVIRRRRAGDEAGEASAGEPASEQALDAAEGDAEAPAAETAAPEADESAPEGEEEAMSSRHLYDDAESDVPDGSEADGSEADASEAAAPDEDEVRVGEEVRAEE